MQALQVNSDIYIEHLWKDTQETDNKVFSGWRTGDFLCLLIGIL